MPDRKINSTTINGVRAASQQRSPGSVLGTVAPPVDMMTVAEALNTIEDKTAESADIVSILRKIERNTSSGNVVTSVGTAVAQGFKIGADKVPKTEATGTADIVATSKSKNPSLERGTATSGFIAKSDDQVKQQTENLAKILQDSVSNGKKTAVKDTAGRMALGSLYDAGKELLEAVGGVSDLAKSGKSTIGRLNNWGKSKLGFGPKTIEGFKVAGKLKVKEISRDAAHTSRLVNRHESSKPSKPSEISPPEEKPAQGTVKYKDRTKGRLARREQATGITQGKKTTKPVATAGKQNATGSKVATATGVAALGSSSGGLGGIVDTAIGTKLAEKGGGLLSKGKGAVVKAGGSIAKLAGPLLSGLTLPLAAAGTAAAFGMWQFTKALTTGESDVNNWFKKITGFDAGKETQGDRNRAAKSEADNLANLNKGRAAGTELIRTAEGGVVRADAKKNMENTAIELRKKGMSEEMVTATLANVQKESGGIARTESMNYKNQSNDRMRTVFGSSTKGMSDEKLTALKNGPEDQLAEAMYGNGTKKGRDMGNTEAGDGYKFRGRGLVQLTGKSNYSEMSQKIYGDDRLVKNPELANDSEAAAKITAEYMSNRQKSAAKKLGLSTGTTDQNEANRIATQAVVGDGVNIDSGRGAEQLAIVNSASKSNLVQGAVKASAGTVAATQVASTTTNPATTSPATTPVQQNKKAEKKKPAPVVTATTKTEKPTATTEETKPENAAATATTAAVAKPTEAAKYQGKAAKQQHPVEGVKTVQGVTAAEIPPTVAAVSATQPPLPTPQPVQPAPPLPVDILALDKLAKANEDQQAQRKRDDDKLASARPGIPNIKTDFDDTMLVLMSYDRI